MPPIIATAILFFGILGLFWLDRDEKVRTSKALWIPVMWLLLAGSRNVSEWLNLSPVTDSPDRYLDGNPVDRAVFTGLLALGVTVLVARERQLGRLLRANGLILLFFCYGALSVLWSDYPAVSFKRWVKDLGDFVMILIVLT